MHPLLQRDLFFIRILSIQTEGVLKREEVTENEGLQHRTRFHDGCWTCLLLCFCSRGFGEGEGSLKR